MQTKYDQLSKRDQLRVGIVDIQLDWISHHQACAAVPGITEEERDYHLAEADRYRKAIRPEWAELYNSIGGEIGDHPYPPIHINK